ncbi:S41 family peptidase [Acidobacteriota bacterium]
MNKKNIHWGLITAMIAVSLFLAVKGNLLPGLSAKSTNYEKYQILGSAISLIRYQYVEEPDALETMEGGYKGLIDALDVMSSYLSKPLLEKFRMLRDQSLPEPGLVLYKTFGAFPQVIGVKEGSPAEKMGLKYGDFISALDSKSTLNMSMREVNLLLKDPLGKPVTLKVLRAEQTEDVIVERKLLFSECYSFSPLKNTAGRIKIYSLNSCTEGIKEKVLPLIKEKNIPLVIDLRNCSEGNILEAQKLVNLFTSAEKIGHFSNKIGETDYLSASGDPVLPDIPLVIWTNRGTMGPAEMAAAILKDIRKAKVVGVQTTGLMSKQRIFSFPDGSGLLLTTEIFNLESKTDIWEKGIEPHEKVNPSQDNTPMYAQATERALLNK